MTSTNNKVILHTATSLDGSTLGLEGKLDLGMFYGLIGKAGWNEDIVLTGSKTMAFGIKSFLGIDPSKEEEATPGEPSTKQVKAGEEEDNKKPMLIIIDSKGVLKCWNVIQSMPHWKKRMCCAISTKTPQSHIDYLRRYNFLDVICVDSVSDNDGHCDLAKLIKHEIPAKYPKSKVIRIDSGGVLSGELFKQGLIDEVSLVALPFIVGSSKFQSFCFSSLQSSSSLSLFSSELLPNSIIWLRYNINH